MSRSDKILATIMIILILWFMAMVIFSFQKPTENIVNVEPVSSSTTIANKTDQPATTTPPIIKNDTVKKEVAKVVQSPPSPMVKAETPSEPPIDYEAINQFAREAIVNILCTSNVSSLRSISGTGVVIDPRGIILTNAHIGQYWLIRDYPTKDSIECAIRIGNPAYPQYRAELMYISPTWVENNKTSLKEAEAMGTGENDFALLFITNKIDNSVLPPSFNYIPPNVGLVKQGETVVLASYPAGFLGGMTVLQNLYMASAITTIQELFTFKENTIDLVSVGGTVVSQKGASGGAVVDKDRSLVGIITTSTDAVTTSQRELNAITISHIDRVLQKETNGGLANLLAQNPGDIVQTFKSSIQDTLTKLITDVLNN